jgi:predicted ATPase
LVLGVLSDPLRWDDPFPGRANLPLSDYLAACLHVPHLLLEEPESHTHPKLQTQLAHLFVTLARAGRQLIVETHSDHLVRRLRGMVARAGRGSEAEQWLLDNVAIVEVEQTPDGVTRLVQSALTPEGGIAERWPADFIEEASREEQAISFAGLDKTAPEAVAATDAYLKSTSVETQDL